MKTFKQLAIATTLASTLLFSGCGYNTLQVKDEAVTAAWSEVQNQYQRRADLVPNLVNVVKGYAKHEEQVLTEVTQARANVAGLKVDKEVLEDPALLEKYQQAQSQLTGALSRLIAVSENYPDLKPIPNSKNCKFSLREQKTELLLPVIVILQLFRTITLMFVSSHKQ